MNLLQRIIILAFPVATFSIGIYGLFNLTDVKLKVTYSCESKNISEIWKLNSTQKICYLENSYFRIKPADIHVERNYTIPTILMMIFIYLVLLIKDRKERFLATWLGIISLFIFLFLLIYSSIISS